MNVSDAVLVAYSVLPMNGHVPKPIWACGDANGDGGVDVSDTVYIIYFAFAGGVSPWECYAGSYGDEVCCPYGSY